MQPRVSCGGGGGGREDKLGRKRPWHKTDVT